LKIEVYLEFGTWSLMKLVIATQNAHKTGEIRAILGDLVEEVTDLASCPGISAPAETGATFEENAAIKALAASAALGPGVCVLADDSGLEVDALGGAPGVFSARYAGPGATDADNRRKLLDALAATGARGRERAARFRCAMVLARGGKAIATAEGVVEGVIANREKGDGGFGYDPLFIPAGHCESFGQLPASVKNSFSHRARALTKIKAALESGGKRGGKT
jgi:XTP/dITP diphosphohydrolase